MNLDKKSVIKLEKSKGKIIFNNSFGTIYENKIQINNKNEKTELLITDIANFRMIRNKDTTINIILFLITTIIAGLTFFFNMNESLSLISYGTSFLFLLLTMFYEKSIYSVQIVLCLAKQIIIKINKKEKNEAYKFIKKLESYKGSNPNLMTLND